MAMTQTEFTTWLMRVEKKIDNLTNVMSQLLVMLGEDEPELPDNTLDGQWSGRAREEGQSLG